MYFVSASSGLTERLFSSAVCSGRQWAGRVPPPPPLTVDAEKVFCSATSSPDVSPYTRGGHASFQAESRQTVHHPVLRMLPCSNRDYYPGNMVHGT